MMCFISLDYDITAASAMGRKGFLGAYRQVGSCHMLNPIIYHSASRYLHKAFLAVNRSEEVPVLGQMDKPYHQDCQYSHKSPEGAQCEVADVQVRACKLPLQTNNLPVYWHSRYAAPI